MTTEKPAVRLTRTLPAPPERVYRAWLDPETLRRWFAPEGWDIDRVEVDERVGGRIAAWHVQDGEQQGGNDSEILELVPDERIVLAWRFVGPDRSGIVDGDSRLTIDLRPAEGGGTELTLVHERLEALAAAMPHVVEGVEPGWTGTLGRLADALVAGGR